MSTVEITPAAPAGAAWRREVIGGITTFLTMSYIIVVNPAILSTPGTGLPASGVLTATVMLAGAMTLLMGLYARLPFAVAPGMGLNAFFTFHVILGRHVPWPTALGLVTWAGVVFLLVSVTPLRVAIARAVPHHLRLGASAGIGLLLSFIGLKAAGLVVAHPVTLVTAGSLGKPALLFGLGLLFTLFLWLRGNPLALLGGIVVTTLVGALLGEVRAPAALVSLPDLSLVGRADLLGALRLGYLPILLAIVLTDLFDSLSTFVGVAHATGLVDERGEPRQLGRALIVDALATLCAGLVGTSAGTAYIESAAGIRAGGRTGLVAVVCALCFVPFLFLGPLAALVPPAATAPALVLVGVSMFMSGVAAGGPRERIEEALPSYFTLLLIPLTSSIAQGILAGFVLHVVAFTLAGRRRELSATMWALAGVAVLALAVEQGTR
ncbi:MAG TPA: NCS2 family permease [Polyangia bacterium]|nr:NCS2 family permease [Polyangia bacterium]